MTPPVAMARMYDCLDVSRLKDPVYGYSFFDWPVVNSVNASDIRSIVMSLCFIISDKGQCQCQCQCHQLNRLVDISIRRGLCVYSGVMITSINT